MNTLIEAIKRVQEKYNLNDKEFSKSLGIDPGHWSRVKRELLPFGQKTLSALSQKYPELDMDIMQHMKGKHAGN